MYCKSCGSEIPDKSRFCPKCGANLASEQSGEIASLVEKLKNGTDQEKNSAFEKLYSLTYTKVYAYVQSKAQDADLSNDAVQTAFITCWNKIGTLEDNGAFVAWMKNIAYRKYLDAAKKTNRIELETPITDDDGNEMNGMENMEDTTMLLPEDAMANAELQQYIIGAINDLPENQRIAIKSFYYEQKKITAIADELGSSENTVKSWLLRGKQNLKKSIASYAKDFGYLLVPVAILPFMSILAKKDALACEIGAVASTATLSAVKTKIASGAANQSLNASARAAERTKAFKGSAAPKAENATKEAKKVFDEQIMPGAKKAAEAAQKNAIPAAKSAVAWFAGSSTAVKVGVGIAAAVVLIGGVKGLTGHKNSTTTNNHKTVSSSETDIIGLSESEIFDGVEVRFYGNEGIGDAEIIVNGERGRHKKIGDKEIDYSIDWMDAHAEELADGETIALRAKYNGAEYRKEITVADLNTIATSLDQIPQSAIEWIEPFVEDEVRDVYHPEPEDKFYSDNGRESSPGWGNRHRQRISSVSDPEYVGCYLASWVDTEGKAANRLYYVYKLTATVEYYDSLRYKEDEQHTTQTVSFYNIGYCRDVYANGKDGCSFGDEGQTIEWYQDFTEDKQKYYFEDNCASNIEAYVELVNPLTHAMDSTASIRGYVSIENLENELKAILNDTKGSDRKLVTDIDPEKCEAFDYDNLYEHVLRSLWGE